MMNHWKILSFLVLASIFVQSQETAITESGQKVIIMPDGTWHLESPVTILDAAIKHFNRPITSTTKAQINHGKSLIYYSSKLWICKGVEEGGRLSFGHRNGDGTVMSITERIEVPMDTLREQVIANAKKAAPDLKIVSEEPQIINGKNFLVMEFKATIKGIPFQYLGYYYTGNAGSIQVFAYTAQNLFEEYRKDFTNFLNGVVIEP